MGGLRLCSPIYRTVWLPRRETLAVCRGHGHWWKPSRPALHAAPQATCHCGLYASTSVKRAARFVQGRGSLHEAASFSTMAPLVGSVKITGNVASTGSVQAAVDFGLDVNYSPTHYQVSGHVGGASMDATVNL